MLRETAVWLLVVTMVAGCGSSGQLGRAASRYADNVGGTADDVIARFRSHYGNVPDEQLAHLIDDAADQTAWMDDLAARVAAQQEELATTRAVASATCEIMDAAERAGGWENLTEQDWYLIVAGQIMSQGLAETEEKVLEIYGAIDDQLQYLRETGSVRIDQALEDMACFAV